MGEAKRRHTSGTISAARQAQAAAVGDSVDRVTMADRLWFERRPHRRHRVRIASGSELVQMAAVLDRDRPSAPPPGYRWATVVRRLRPDARLRLHLFVREDSDLDGASEETCRAIYLAAGNEAAARIEAAYERIMAGGDA